MVQIWVLIRDFPRLSSDYPSKDEEEEVEKQKTHDIGPIRVTSPGGTVSIGVTKVTPEPPEKPPWRKHLSDLSWKVAEKTLSRPEVQDFVIEKGKDCIEWVKTILESQQRRRHPAKAG